MTSDCTLPFAGDDLDSLEAVLGPQWVTRFLDDETRHDAVVELADIIDGFIGHHRRADGKGCTCGWNGDNTVAHLLAVLSEHDDDEASLFPLSVDRHDRTRPPGELLRIWAAVGRRSDADVARACEIPLDTYRGILTGSEVITDDLARKLEHGTRTYPKNIWLMLERDYRAALIEGAQGPPRYPS
jgi:plasmid maintenance system antidote protein VapI